MQTFGGQVAACGRPGEDAAMRNACRAPLVARLAVILTTALLAFNRFAKAEQAAPISLNPVNPHYLLFRGKPVFLLGSTEHYGAVMNRDFDYAKYLQTIHQQGMGVTRTFSGSYMEPDGAFNISHNTLAPATEKLIAPWARSQMPGYAKGGNKFDLTKWDDDYFKRLSDFVSQASQRGIVVEMVLFCPYYEEAQWKLSPLNAINNVNRIGAISRLKANTMENGNLLPIQEAMVHKIVTTLARFDNVYFEICNEPYFGGVTLDWQKHIAGVIHEAERSLPHPHLIAQNISNGAKKIEQPDGLVSIFNFHYATPPDAVTMNYGLDRVIADDETGFKGTGDDIYRMEAWDFLLAGGGIFDHLDYSFTAGHEDGTFALPPKQPGGGGVALRRQFAILKAFLESFDFVHMKPDTHVVKGPLPKGVTDRALSEPGKAYAIYVRGKEMTDLKLDLPAGNYRIEWINPVTGKTLNQAELKQSSEPAILHCPSGLSDVALRIVANTSGIH